MDYEKFYDFVVEEKERLLENGVEIIADYRLCKALAACYELQDHLAGVMSGMVEREEIEEFYE